MRFSLKNSKRAAIRILITFCFGFGLLGPTLQTLHSRSIEFSEPDGSFGSTNLNGLTPAPDVLDPYNSQNNSLVGNKLPGRSMRPLPPRAYVTPANRNVSGLKNFPTSGEMMQTIIERDILKSPGAAASPNSLNPLDAYNPLRRGGVTNSARSSDFFGKTGETNKSESRFDGLKAYDPFNSYSAKRDTPTDSPVIGKSDSVWDFLKKNDDNSPEVIKERKVETERAESFRALLESSTRPAQAISRPSAGSVGFSTPAFGGMSPSPSSPSSSPILATPKAPVAPTAPIAPGQSPTLTYTPLPKPKPTSFEAPKRTF